MRWLDGITSSMDMNLGKFREVVKDKEVWHPAIHGVTKSWTQLSDFDVSLSELREMVMDREAWHAVLHGVAKSRT